MQIIYAKFPDIQIHVASHAKKILPVLTYVRVVE